MGKIGSEFSIDTIPGILASAPDVTGLSGGGFAVVWGSIESQTTPYDIRARLFNADGTATGTDFVVNSTENGFEVNPNIATLTDGRFVVTWDNSSEVRARIFNSDGSPSDPDGAGPATNLDFSIAAGTNSSVAALPDGRFVAGWQVFEGSQGSNVRAEIFNADGTPFDPDGSGPASPGSFLLSTSANNFQGSPELTAMPGGHFGAVWLSDDGPSSSTTRNIHVGLFNSDGTPFDPDGSGPATSELTINPFGSSPGSHAQVFDPKIASLSDGRFVVTWATREGNSADVSVKAEIFNADGTPNDPDGSGPLTSGVHILQDLGAGGSDGSLDISVLPNDRFVISWETNTANGKEIEAQVFNSDGTAYDPDGSGPATPAPFLVNSNGLNTDEFAPAVATLGNGHFTIVWQSDHPIPPQNDDDQDTSLTLSHDEGQVFQIDGMDLIGTRDSDQGSGAVTGTGNPERIDGLEGEDHLFGLGGADALYGDLGDDVLNGGPGGDALAGGAGFDTASYATATSGLRADMSNPNNNTGDAAGDTYNSVENILGTNLNDSLVGNSGENALYGSGGDDTIAGMAGTDALFGGAGDDVLYGQGGHDMLDGGAGDDMLYGGTGGSDRFLFQNGWGHDSVLDYETSDRFDFRGTNLTMDQLTIEQDGSSVLIAGPDGNSITLWNTNVSDVGPSNFLFSNGTILASLDMEDHTYTAQRVSFADAKQSINLVGGTATGFEIGTDTINAQDIIGGGGNDTLEGYNRIAGGDGNDVIQATNYENGGAGDDLLIADSAHTTLIGGAGSDTFRFESGAQATVIQDFAENGPVQDALDISQMIADTDSRPHGLEEAVSGGYVRFAQSGHDALVYTDADGFGDTYGEVLIAVMRNVSSAQGLEQNVIV